MNLSQLPATVTATNDCSMVPWPIGIWSSSGARLGEPGQVVDASAQPQTRRPTCVVMTAEGTGVELQRGQSPADGHD